VSDLRRVPFAPIDAWLCVIPLSWWGDAVARGAYRWRAEGVPLFTADRICCEVLGVHPAQVYGSAWFTFGDEEESATSEEHHGHDHTETHAEQQEVRVHA
jgi:hypothetical protein